MKSLLESGAIRAEGGDWRIAAALDGGTFAARPAGSPRIADIFRERLARLDREHVEVLEVLAVARRPSTEPLLAAALGNAPALGARLAALASRGILVRESDAAGRGTFRFAHELFRHTVYAGI